MTKINVKKDWMLKQMMTKFACLKIDYVRDTAFDGHNNVKLDGKHD